MGWLAARLASTHQMPGAPPYPAVMPTKNVFGHHHVSFREAELPPLRNTGLYAGFNHKFLWD